MTSEMVEEADRAAARTRAFRLIQDIQAAVPTAAAELEVLARLAAERGWSETVRAGLFGRAVDAWFRREGNVDAAVAALIERCEADEDAVMLAVALALRSDPGFGGGAAAPAGVSGEEDLARAVVLLEQAEGAPLECITAHTACGIALAGRWLFELADEQYAAALAVGASEPPGSVDFLLAPVMFDRAELHLAWASLLRQLGEREAVVERWHTWRAAGVAAASFALPEAWQVELVAHGLLLAAIAGEDTGDEARRRLERLEGRGLAALRAEGHLQLAAALSDSGAGRPGAKDAAVRAARTIDPDVSPQAHDLALYLLAEMEAADGREAGLRYGRRQLAEHWASRLASLGAMRARLHAERLAAERDILSRHARQDDLTGVGNRRALEQYLADAERVGVDRVALILLDVNDFKGVNDRHGHLAGDAVLVRIGQTLERSIRPSDLAVRLGGDEFAVVLAHADVETATERAADILAQMDGQSFEDVAPGLVIAMCAGVAAGDPTHITELRAQADAALYRAKAGEGRALLRSRVARASPA